MRTLSHNLLNEIQGIDAPEKILIPKINYHALIARQQEVIKKLQQEIKYLRQYILYFAGEQEVEEEKQLETDSSLKTVQDKQISIDRKSETMENSKKKSSRSLKHLLKQIMAAIDVQNVDQVVEKLKIIIEKANRKMQPIFIERIKYKQVPVPMQIIKEVEKEVIVYKQKIVEVPIFREKIVQRFTAKPPEPQQASSQVSSAQNVNANKIQKDGITAANQIQETKENQNQFKQSDEGRKKFDNSQSSKMNHTFNAKSPRYKERGQYMDRWNNYNGPRSPRYRQKD